MIPATLTTGRMPKNFGYQIKRSSVVGARPVGEFAILGYDANLDSALIIVSLVCHLKRTRPLGGLLQHLKSQT